MSNSETFLNSNSLRISKTKANTKTPQQKSIKIVSQQTSSFPRNLSTDVHGEDILSGNVLRTVTMLSPTL